MTFNDSSPLTLTVVNPAAENQPYVYVNQKAELALNLRNNTGSTLTLSSEGQISTLKLFPPSFYTDEELAYCVQVIEHIAAHPACDGNVGMMGKSWSAINSLMVAARKDRPQALKAVIVCCGSDARRVVAGPSRALSARIQGTVRRQGWRTR